MAHIKKIKTIYGMRYAVVEPFTSETKNLKGEKVVTTKEYSVEYKRDKEIALAIFPVTEEGLIEAKEVQKLFNK